MTDEAAIRASDPSTPLEELAALAYEHAELRALVAANPSTYPDLLTWLGALGEPEVDAALANRPSGDSESAIPEATVVPPETETTPSAPGVSPAKASFASRRLIFLLVAGVAIVVVAVAGWFAYPAFVQPLLPGAADATSVRATDYRFGAASTWQTKVDVVEAGSDGFADYYVKVQSYPKLWLVSWPGDASGAGGLTNESLLGMDPETGSVMWSLEPGPFECASTLASGALACVNTAEGSLQVLSPSTGQPTDSPLNGMDASSVSSFDGDLVVAYQDPSANNADTVQRMTLAGTVMWTKSASCDTSSASDGITIVSAGQAGAVARDQAGMGSHDALVYGGCLWGKINLDSGEVDPDANIAGDGCLEGQPFDDEVGVVVRDDACATSPILFARGASTITAVEADAYRDWSGTYLPTAWSAELPGAAFADQAYDQMVYVGGYALVASAGNLYGIDAERGPRWTKSDAFSDDGKVVLRAIDSDNANSPILAIDAAHQTIVRLDPAAGATEIPGQPKILPSCPQGQTSVSFSSWDNGKGATLVCEGFARTVTVILITNGTTYTSDRGTVTPAGYHADFGGGMSVEIGFAGWVTWVTQGTQTALYSASRGWQPGDVKARAYPAMNADVEPCPAGTYPLSLSTWEGGWLLTCGEKSTSITRFVYVDGSSHGSGGDMTTEGGQSCGRNSAGLRVCVNASPAVVEFSSQGGTPTQHSVASNYVVGQGFSGAGVGTGAYGLADPKADAASQVAYLNGILQQSQSSRSSVKTVVRNILTCASLQADVDAAKAVVAERTTELYGLNSAPVDAIPGGAEILSQLRAVLQDSLTADRAYVTAAGQVAAGQCSAGISTYSAQTALIQQITAEKTAFVKVWNTQIAPIYGTPSYTEDGI